MFTPYCVLQLQEIFRKKNEKKGRKGDAEKSAQLVRILTCGSVTSFKLKMKRFGLRFGTYIRKIDRVLFWSLVFPPNLFLLKFGLVVRSGNGN